MFIISRLSCSWQIHKQGVAWQSEVLVNTQKPVQHESAACLLKCERRHVWAHAAPAIRGSGPLAWEDACRAAWSCRRGPPRPLPPGP